MLKCELVKNKMERREGLNHLRVTVTPEVTTNESKKPIAFIVVLDISGSMSGFATSTRYGGYPTGGFWCNGMPGWQNQKFMHIEQKESPMTKLDYAKNAAEKLVDTLSNGDYLGVVTFDHIAHIEYELTQLNRDEKMKAKHQIRQIQTQGSTNISDGLETAYRMIPDSLKETHHIKMILLSDGEANYGITNADAMATQVADYRKKGVNISTIGIGMDYNSYFMENIATASGGMFYHLTKMEQLKEIFSQELSSLVSLTTKDAQIQVKVPEGLMLDENLNGFAEKEKGVIYLGNVYSELDILFEIQTKNAQKGKVNLTIKLEYQDDAQQFKTEKVKIPIQLVDEEDAENVEINKETAELVKKIIQAKVQKEALRQYEKFDSVSANQLIRQGVGKFTALNLSYGIDAQEGIREMNALEQKITQSKLDSDQVKTMYSTSYNTTRNKI